MNSNAALFGSVTAHGRANPKRVVSLLASATEIVAALGMGNQLVGRSHRCDYPPEVECLPVCTRPRIALEGTSREIDQRVQQALTQGWSLYQVDSARLKALRPDLILTQTQCAVCAATPRDVECAFGEGFVGARQPELLSLEPHVLEDVWENIRRIGAALDVPARASELAGALADRISRVRRRTAERPASKVAVLEWLAPVVVAGNWVPELVAAAGGRNLLAKPGQHSPHIAWNLLADADPDVILVSLCGFSLSASWVELNRVTRTPEWATLRAVRSHAVYAVDDTRSRPGPRLVEFAEIMAEILHPDACDFGYRGTGWVAVDEQMPARV